MKLSNQFNSIQIILYSPISQITNLPRGPQDLTSDQEKLPKKPNSSHLLKYDPLRRCDIGHPILHAQSDSFWTAVIINNGL